MNEAASPYAFLRTAAPIARGSLTTEVAAALRDAIVSLHLAPGIALDKNAIAARLGVSRFPVSEALARLQAEGLVDIAPQRGSTVSLVRLADVREYMLIRKGLEGEALRIFIDRNDPALRDALNQNLALQHRCAAAEDADGFHWADIGFHDIIFQATRYSRMRGIIEQARANLDRARRLIITPRRLAHTIGEHEAIAAAIAALDVGGATRALRAHVDAVMVELFAFARLHPALFADSDSLDAEDHRFPFG